MKTQQQNNMALEFGPLIAFVLSYYFGEQLIATFNLAAYVTKPIFLATIILLATTPLAVLIGRIYYGTFPIMPTFTLFIVVIFSSLTLYFQNEIFIKMKPTILNILYALAMLGGLAFNKNLLKIVMGQAFSMTNEGWDKLTIRWCIMLFFLAIVNEIVWRNTSESFWVGFKLWGMTGLTFLFIASQIPFMMKHKN